MRCNALQWSTKQNQIIDLLSSGDDDEDDEYNGDDKWKYTQPTVSIWSIKQHSMYVALVKKAKSYM